MKQNMSISTLSALCAEYSGDDHEEGLHAELSYDEVVAAGPAARPLDFPAPTVHRCAKIDIEARDHRSGTIHFLRNVIVRSHNPDIAYLIKKKLSKSVYGSIRLCIVLKKRQQGSTGKSEQKQGSAVDAVEWESTDLQAVVKISEFSRIHGMRGRHLEDPIREISAMQLLGNYHPHVLGAQEILQDDNYLYTVTRHLPGGELYGRLVDSFPQKRPAKESEGSKSSFNYDESQARVWFRQLLMALYQYQKKGVCHRDISLENILLDDQDRVVLIDPGMSLRVPYSDPCNPDCVSDVSSGTSRRLMVAQGQGGKLMYAAPEVINQSDVLDAFAVDLWAAGIVLFVMLVGLAPFKWAHPSDKRFSKIARGGLKDFIAALDIPLSPEATDLLQGFFWSDPRKRWTLAEVLDHPWIHGKQFKNVTFSPTKTSSHRFGFLGSKARLATGCDKPPNFSPQARLVAPDNAYFC